MKKFWWIYVFVVVVLLASLVAGCAKPSPSPTPTPTPKPTPSPSPSPSPTPSPTPKPTVQPIELTYSDFHIWGTPQTEMAKWYLDEVSRRSGGLVKFKYFWAGSLTPAMETLPAVRSGAVDISNPPPAYWPADQPLLNLFNSCRIPPEADTAMRKGVEIMWYSGEISKMLAAESFAQNTHLLYWFPMHYAFVTKPKVEKLADLKGLKMRGIGIYEPKVLGTWGIISVNVVPAEFYESLQRGALDGLSAIYDNFTDYKLYEVAKYLSFRNGAIMSQPMCMNLDVWNKKLPKEVKDLIESESFRKEVLEKFMQIFNQRDGAIKDILVKNGVNIVKVDPKEQQAVWDKWIEVVVREYPPETAKRGKGPGGLRILDKWLELCTGQNLAAWDKKFGITR